MRFRPLDLVIPWGTGLGAAALCAYGTVRNWGEVPGYICMVTGLVFLAGIPLWYIIRSR